MNIKEGLPVGKATEIGDGEKSIPLPIIKHVNTLMRNMTDVPIDAFSCIFNVAVELADIEREKNGERTILSSVPSNFEMIRQPK